MPDEGIDAVQLPRENDTEVVKSEEIATSTIEFIGSSQRIIEEMKRYLSVLHAFQQSNKGRMIAEQAHNLRDIISYIEHSPDQSLQLTKQSYEEAGIPYEEGALRQILSDYTENLIERAQTAITHIRPDINDRPLNKHAAISVINRYFEDHGISLIIDSATDRLSLFLGDLAVDLSPVTGIISESINGPRLPYLQKFYTLLLHQIFEALPRGLTCIYPAIGDDKSFCDVARSYGNRTIAIDGNPDIIAQPDIALMRDITSVEDLIKIMPQAGNSSEVLETALIIKGFDTLEDVSQDVIEKILDIKQWKYVILLGCTSSSVMGWGIPSVDGRAYHSLEAHHAFKNTTNSVFNEEAIKVMRVVTAVGTKFEWASGHFPATLTRLYIRL